MGLSLWEGGTGWYLLFSSLQNLLSEVAKERDFAMQEMKAMSEQCQLVAGEFEGLAKQYEALNQQLKEVQFMVIN